MANEIRKKQNAVLIIKIFMADKTASVVQKELLAKYRKTAHSIIRMLKEFLRLSWREDWQSAWR